MTTAQTSRDTLADNAARLLAEKAVERFPACFWMRRADAPLRSVADVELVVQRLRQHANRAGWDAALEIERCL